MHFCWLCSARFIATRQPLSSGVHRVCHWRAQPPPWQRSVLAPLPCPTALPSTAATLGTLPRAKASKDRHYLTATFGVRWTKSCCAFCPFAKLKGAAACSLRTEARRAPVGNLSGSPALSGQRQTGQRWQPEEGERTAVTQDSLHRHKGRGCGAFQDHDWRAGLDRRDRQRDR